MATVTYIPESKQSISAMKGLIDYCCQECKTLDELSGEYLISGVNVNGTNAYREFMITKNSYHKTGGMNFYQYVQSFSPNEKVTAEQVHKIGLEFAEKAWPEHEVLVTTHTDAEHLHNHFVINSVNFNDGRKLRQNPKTLKVLRDMSDCICIEHGLSVLKPYEKDGAKLSSREYRTASKGESWKFKLISDIDFVMNRSGSRDDFIKEMNRLGYQITWTDERKYITFTCPNGLKCRDIRLHDEKYLKGVLEYEFTIRRQHTAKQRREYAETEKREDTLRTGTDTLSATGVCNPDRTTQTGEQTFGRCSGVSAEAVSADRGAGDSKRTERPLHRDTGYRGVLYGKYSSESCDSQHEYGGEDANYRRTGWEDAREVYFGLLRNAFQEYREVEQCGRETATENHENNFGYSGVVSGAVGVGMRGILEAGSIIDSTSEDPEERRKRIEAEENASNIGAIIGLAAGILFSDMSDDSELPEELSNEQNDIRMNM